MFCGGCGTEIAEGRRFCGSCGAALHAAVPSSAAATPLRPLFTAIQPVKVRAPWSTAKKAGLSLGLLLLVTAGGGWWWWTHRPVPEYKVQDPGLYPFPGLSSDGKTEQTGFMDANGNVVVEPVWDAASPTSILGRFTVCNEGMCAVVKNGKWGYIDTSGKLVVSNQFDSAGPFVEGLAAVTLGNRIGYIDKSGSYVINPQFDGARNFHSGLAAVHLNGVWGFIDRSGTWVIPALYTRVDTDGFSEGLAGVCAASKTVFSADPNRCGYLAKDGRFAIQPQFEDVSTFSGGLAPVKLADKWGYVDKSGKLAINPQFDKAGLFSGGIAVVEIAGNVGTIDHHGKFIINPGQYSVQFDPDELLRASTSDGYGLLSRGGKWVVPPSHALTGIGAIYGKVFFGHISGQWIPISLAGTVLSGSYKGANLASLVQDLANEAKAQNSMQVLVSAESTYSNTFPQTGFAASLSALGPANGNPDEHHAGIIDATLATETHDGYQFSLSIPAGNATGGTNFNYQITATPAAGHAGRIFCADSTGTIRYAQQGTQCTPSSPAAAPISVPSVQSQVQDKQSGLSGSTAEFSQRFPGYVESPS